MPDNNVHDGDLTRTRARGVTTSSAGPGASQTISLKAISLKAIKPAGMTGMKGTT
ncbi:hypothetical protein ABZ464_49635 [Streptomyces sp. NPDC005820]|uniref:hypothetical protein n=1 Tax=Streptomyces sp. NPDC005820 TaxID=3157069 RepID=UPI00340FC7F3